MGHEQVNSNQSSEQRVQAYAQEVFQKPMGIDSVAEGGWIKPTTGSADHNANVLYMPHAEGNDKVVASVTDKKGLVTFAPGDENEHMEQSVVSQAQYRTHEADENGGRQFAPGVVRSVQTPKVETFYTLDGPDQMPKVESQDVYRHEFKDKERAASLITALAIKQDSRAREERAKRKAA